MDIPAEILLPDVYNDDLLMDSLAMHRMDDDGSFAYQSSSSAHLTQHEATSLNV
jgi:hypothetical protein